MALDIAHDEARAGLLDEADDALRRALAVGPDRGSEPLLRFTLAWLASRRGDEVAAGEHLARAREASPEYVFPARLEELAILNGPSGATRPTPVRPTTWATCSTTGAATAKPSTSGALRHASTPASRPCTATWASPSSTSCGAPGAHAPRTLARCGADPSDARVLYEHDQLRRRLGDAPAARLRDLERRRDVRPRPRRPHASST